MTKKLTIDQLQLTAQNRGGECLVQNYVNSTQKIDWKCANGHIFSTSTRDVRSGKWCPTCAKHFFFKEELCRTTFEQIFSEKFPRLRPKWLINKSGSRLEIDGFCKKLKLGFEYNGEQHFSINFYTNQEKLTKQIENDRLKLQLFKQKSLTLLVFDHNDNLENLPSLIEQKLSNKKDLLRSANFDISINFDQVWQHQNKISKLRELASSRLGKLISDKYIDQKQKLLWQCANGHQWYASATNITSGTWCPTCAIKNSQLKLSDAIEFAKQNQGICLSETYDSNKKLKWQCSKGHIWDSTFLVQKSRTYWCNECEKERRVIQGEKIILKINIDDMRRLAQAKSGKCLSSEYKGSDIKLKWQCSKGHIWDAVPSSVKSGRWCPDCAGRPRLNLENAKLAAFQFGGKCLSKEYINVKSPMKWSCSEGHEWITSFDSVRQGNWCRRCSQKRRRMRERNNNS